MLRRSTICALTCAGLYVAAGTASAQTPGLPPVPIPTDPQSGDVAQFEGTPAEPRPVKKVTDPPQNPFMAPNGRSNIHNDAYMTDVYHHFAGPLGRNTAVNSTFFARECGSLAFDSFGRVVTICIGLDRPVLALLDPTTLRTLAAMQLPPRNVSGNPFSDFTGGGYFYLDHRDRAVLPTSDRHILEIAVSEGPVAPTFGVTRDYDVSAAVPSGDGIVSVLPDWSGRIWFVSRGGVVGLVNRTSGVVHSLRLTGEGISNSFAVDESGGVFIVSDAALYRFDADPDDEPAVSWRRVYENSGVRKPGQSDAGSGTTPTLLGPNWVAITDNADPMNVVVYERDRQASPTTTPVCRQPIFSQGASATDQSLIGTDHSLIAENNFGYSGPLATEQGGVTSPGLARVDVPGNGRCRTVWMSDERAPSVVPKLSLANGLVYTYTKPKRDDSRDAWYFTALDFRTGRTVYRRLAGVGLGYNNNFAPVTLGPDGAGYVGALGGLVRFADGG